MTAPTAYRFATVRGRTIRITKLDACGMPVAGSANQFVARTFATVKKAANRDMGEEIKVRNADDTIGNYQRGRKTLLDFDIEITFSASDTGALPMMSGDPVVLDWQSTVVGWEELALTAGGATWALEVWTGTSQTACSSTGAQYGYYLFPFIENAHVESDDITNKESNFTVKANTKGPNQWGKGPYLVVPTDSSNTAGRLLVPVAANAHDHFQLTTIAPPAVPANAGPQSLTLPSPY